MKEHLKTDSLSLGETDSFSIDYVRQPEIIYPIMLKNQWTFMYAVVGTSCVE